MGRIKDSEKTRAGGKWMRWTRKRKREREEGNTIMKRKRKIAKEG
jgi:hypothetical protein